MEFLQSNTKGESDRQLDGGGRKGCFMFFVCDRFQLVDGGWVVGFQEVDAWTEGGWDRDGGWVVVGWRGKARVGCSLATEPFLSHSFS